MALDISSGVASGAQAYASTGNPYIAAGAALLGGILGGKANRRNKRAARLQRAVSNLQYRAARKLQVREYIATMAAQAQGLQDTGIGLSTKSSGYQGTMASLQTQFASNIRDQEKTYYLTGQAQRNLGSAARMESALAGLQNIFTNKFGS